MDAFQRGFRRDIPLEKAASFFVGLKRWQAPAPSELALMKQAAHVAAGLPPVAGGQTKSASARLRAMLDFYKQASEDSTDGGGSELSSPTPAAVPQEQEYLANEAAGLEAEETNAVEYYKTLLEQLRGETAAAQEQAQQATEQAQQLQAQQAEHDAQIQASAQEASMAQQAALQQVQTANAAATQAMQQAVDAENRALQAKTQETTAKIQQQQVRTQLLDMAAQGLPGSEPELGGEGNAAEGMEGAPPPAQAGGVPGEDPAVGGQEATAAAGPNAGGLNEQGQPANADGMPGQEAAPGGAGGGAAAPGTTPQPAGDSSGGSGAGPGTGPQSNTDGQAQVPEADSTAKRQGGVSIKVGQFGNPRLVALLDRLEGEQRLPLAVGN